MAIGRSKAIGIEGSNGVGKTTVGLGLSAQLRKLGYNAIYCDESARMNPLVEDNTIHHHPLTIWTELQLYCSTYASQILSARYADILVCDKTPASVLAYAQLLLMDRDPTEMDLHIYDAMCAMWRSSASASDAIVLLDNRYTFEEFSDPIRTPVSHLRDQLGEQIARIITEADCYCVRPPISLNLADRIDWIIEILSTGPSTLISTLP